MSRSDLHILVNVTECLLFVWVPIVSGPEVHTRTILQTYTKLIDAHHACPIVNLWNLSMSRTL